MQEREDVGEIRTLQSPPEGWTYDPDKRRHQLAERTRERIQNILPNDKHGHPISIPNTGLPVLSEGDEIAGHRCVCGSTETTSDYDTDGFYGRLLCIRLTCSRQVAWLYRSARLTVVRETVRPNPTSAIVKRPPKQIPAAIPRYVFTTIDGCDETCTMEYGHDPMVHQMYGRAYGYQEALEDQSTQRNPSEGLSCGPITVGPDRTTIIINGQTVRIVGKSYAVMLQLMIHYNGICPYYRMAQAAFGPDEAIRMRSLNLRNNANSKFGKWSALRMLVLRIRGKLKPYGLSVAAVDGIGYRLVDVTT